MNTIFYLFVCFYFNGVTEDVPKIRSVISLHASLKSVYSTDSQL